MKGRVLASPKGLSIRPTSDRVREALFNIVGQDLTGFRVLDLFAGTGSLGIEALSRGAEFAVFIDNSLHARKIIQKNLALCGNEEYGLVLRWDLSKGIYRGGELRRKIFDLVFLDPPYGKNLIPFMLRELSAENTLFPAGMVIAECSKAEDLPFMVGDIELRDMRTYGDTKLNWYGKRMKNE